MLSCISFSSVLTLLIHLIYTIHFSMSTIFSTIFHFFTFFCKNKKSIFIYIPIQIRFLLLYSIFCILFPISIYYFYLLFLFTHQKSLLNIPIKYPYQISLLNILVYYSKTLNVKKRICSSLQQIRFLTYDLYFALYKCLYTIQLYKTPLD